MYTDGIIFDIDGTLWNSTPTVADSWNVAIRKFGELHPELPKVKIVVTDKVLQEQFGKPLEDIARDIFPEIPDGPRKQLEIMCEEHEQNAIKNAGAVPLYPGMDLTLHKLAERYPLFIVSNCQAGYAEILLDVTHTQDIFKDHLCPGDTGLLKADNILEIKRRYNLQAPVYIGDTQGDANACAQANVPIVYCSYGFGKVAHPAAIIEKPEDLLKLF